MRTNIRNVFPQLAEAAFDWAVKLAYLQPPAIDPFRSQFLHKNATAKTLQ